MIDKLAPDCKTETAILAELRRQYGEKDRVINHILEDVANLQNPLSDPLKCADFYRAILSALNDLNDLDKQIQLLLHNLLGSCHHQLERSGGRCYTQ